MTHIVVNDEQAKLIAEATEYVEIHDPQGRRLGYVARGSTADESAPVPLDRALAHILEDAERLAQTLPPVHPSPARDDWAEIVTEKYRNQGFSL